MRTFLTTAALAAVSVIGVSAASAQGFVPNPAYVLDPAPVYEPVPVYAAQPAYVAPRRAPIYAMSPVGGYVPPKYSYTITTPTTQTGTVGFGGGGYSGVVYERW